MKLTASQLKKIIAEETRRALREVDLAASREVYVDVPDGRLGMYDAASIDAAKGKIASAASRNAVDAAALAADDLRMDIYYEALDGDADGDEDEAYEMASAAMAQFWGEMMDEGHVDPNFVVRAKSAFDAKWL